MHQVDFLPLLHPYGYRQVMFQDYKNIFGGGTTCLYLHTSPHKQYYLYMAESLEAWLEQHYYKLKNRVALVQNDKLSYFLNVKNIQDPEFKNGSVTRQNGIEICAQGQFEMLQSSIYPENY